MKAKRGVYIGIISIFGIFIVSSLASAGLLDWIRENIRLAPSESKNVTVTVRGVNPVVVEVFNETLTGINPSIESTTSVNFKVRMTDPDGRSDLNDTSVVANFSRAGEALRQNLSCSFLTGQETSTSANYSCTIYMWYYDQEGTWNINACGTDLGNLTLICNTTTTFSYGLLKAISITGEEIAFPDVTPGDVDQASTNDPTRINNTGNYEGYLNVTGIDLFGETITSEFIGAGNFTLNQTFGSECNAIPLVNGTAIGIIPNIPRGNLSAGVGNTTLYYCLDTVPSVGISSQIYSTLNGGSWTIGI